MEIPVKLNGQRQKVKVVFAKPEDLKFVAQWKNAVGDDQNPYRVDIGGSPQGHEVQHWLAAEEQSLAERKLTQVHGFQNRINFPSNPILLVKQ